MEGLVGEREKTRSRVVTATRRIEDANREAREDEDVGVGPRDSFASTTKLALQDRLRTVPPDKPLRARRVRGPPDVADANIVLFVASNIHFKISHSRGDGRAPPAGDRRLYALSQGARSERDARSTNERIRSSTARRALPRVALVWYRHRSFKSERRSAWALSRTSWRTC